jgi:hypothetical protein
MITSRFPSSAFSSFCYLSGVSDALLFLSQNLVPGPALFSPSNKWAALLLHVKKLYKQVMSSGGPTMMPEVQLCGFVITRHASNGLVDRMLLR